MKNISLETYDAQKIGINDLHVRHEDGKYVIFYKKPIYVGEVSEDELDDYEKEKCNDHLIIMKWLSGNHDNAARHHRMTNAEFMVDHGLEFHNLKWSYTENHNKILYTIKSNSNELTDLISMFDDSQFFPSPVVTDEILNTQSLTEILVCYERGEPRSDFITDWLDCPFDATELDLNFKISLLLINQAVETFPVNVVTTASHANQENHLAKH